MKKITVDILIVGGGAAGLFAAARLCGTFRVAVAEYLPRPGLKLLASGNGRCNITNRLAVDDFIASFGEKSRFTAPALRNFPPEKLLAFFRERGVGFTVVDDFYYFPSTGRAGDLLERLLDSRYGVYTSCAVSSLLLRDGGVIGAVSADCEFHADAVIIAAGSRAHPTLGGRGSAVALAEQAGHTVVPPVPALTGLHTVEEWPKILAGVTLENTRLTLDKTHFGAGALLFTQNGVSGPAALDISGAVNRRLAAGAPAVLNCRLNGCDVRRWREIFSGFRAERGGRSVLALLREYFPSRLLRLLDIPDTPVARLDGDSRERIIGVLSSSPLTVCASDSWDKAMAADGGVALPEVNSKTMESRIVSNLYFAGEFLDVTGRCGGYNLQWAFSSAELACEAIRRRSRAGARE